jgi:hypothetical protein
MRHSRRPRPARAIIISRIVASESRRVDPEFRPPLSVGCNRIGHIDKYISLRMSLQPHTTNQIGQLADACQPILDRISQLISTGERIPYLNDEVGRSILIGLPRDLE